MMRSLRGIRMTLMQVAEQGSDTNFMPDHVDSLQCSFIFHHIIFPQMCVLVFDENPGGTDLLTEISAFVSEYFLMVACLWWSTDPNIGFVECCCLF